MTATEHFVSPPDLPTPTGEALCRLCAGRDAGCCRTDPALSHLSFPLSGAEWRRLAPYACLATLSVPADGDLFAHESDAADREADRLAKTPPLPPVQQTPPPKGDTVCSVERNTPDFITSMHTLFPGEKQRVDSLFPQGGTHGALRIRSDGACVFLGASGCRLPRPVRPWYCLLFPAWVVENSLTLFSAQDCLIAQRARGLAHGLSLLDEQPARLRELHAALRRDWGLKTPF